MGFKTIEDLAGLDWMRVLGVDLMGAFYFANYAFRTMKPGGHCELQASMPYTEALAAAYAAAKAALLSLTRTTSIEGKPKGSEATPSYPGR